MSKQREYSAELLEIIGEYIKDENLTASIHTIILQNNTVSTIIKAYDAGCNKSSSSEYDVVGVHGNGQSKPKFKDLSHMQGHAYNHKAGTLDRINYKLKQEN